MNIKVNIIVNCLHKHYDVKIIMAQELWLWNEVYNIKIAVQWGEFSARGGELPLITSVGKPWEEYNFGGGSTRGIFLVGRRQFAASEGDSSLSFPQ